MARNEQFFFMAGALYSRPGRMTNREAEDRGKFLGLITENPSLLYSPGKKVQIIL